MPTVDMNLNKQTIGSLWAVNRKLYAIPDSELNAMSPEDIKKCKDSLNLTDLAIRKLEAAKLMEVNDHFKAEEDNLKNAAAKLESAASGLADTVKMIQVISDGMKLVMSIVALLG